MDLKEQEAIGADIHAHWYYRGKAAALARCAGLDGYRTILDVGAGSGFFARYLLRHSSAEAAYCVDINYSAEWDGTVCGKPVYFRRSCGAIDADLVLLMDVLEHVDDDAALLSDYARSTPSSARFMITVPAFRWLWSGHDVFLGHRRRYTLSDLDRVVRRAGLQPLRRCYFFAGVFPLVASLRVLDRLCSRRGGEPRSSLRRHAYPVNALLTALCLAEIPVMRFNRLAGVSAFYLCRKG